MRKLISYIFIYVLLTGCEVENPLVNEYQECESDFIMNVEAPELELDKNGYYKMEWIEGYTQTFTTLDAVTNTSGYNNIYWNSNNGIIFNNGKVSKIHKRKNGLNIFLKSSLKISKKSIKFYA